jgi:excisionase family DNA binding protein
MTTREIATLLKCSDRHALEMLRRGDIAGFRVGKLWRAEKSAVFAFIRGEKRSR